MKSAINRGMRIVCALTRLKRDAAVDLATTAIGIVWEEHKTRQHIISDQHDFRDRVSNVSYKLACRELHSRSRIVCYDPTEEARSRPDERIQYARIEPARQIEITYTKEVIRAINLLPLKQREVALLLCEGLNVGDVSLKLHLPLHVCVDRMRAARRMLWWSGLIEVATQGTGIPS